MPTLTWSNARAIGEALYEAHEDVEPLSISFVQLHKWICELDDFEGDPKASNEKSLEAIQMVWYEEWKFDNE